MDKFTKRLVHLQVISK